MTGQPSTSAYWADFLKEMGGEWWTEAEAVEASSFTQTCVNNSIDGMLKLGSLDERKRDQPNSPGPNPSEYRFTLD